jgi:hypothetical protein
MRDRRTAFDKLPSAALGAGRPGKSCATYEALTKIVETLATRMNGNPQN